MSQQKRKDLLRKIETYVCFIRGSLNDYCAKCNRANCICKVKTNKRSFRLTYKDSSQRTRVVYVPRSKVPRIKKMLENNLKMKKTLERLLELNIQEFAYSEASVHPIPIISVQFKPKETDQYFLHRIRTQKSQERLFGRGKRLHFEVFLM